MKVGLAQEVGQKLFMFGGELSFGKLLLGGENRKELYLDMNFSWKRTNLSVIMHFT